MYVVFSFPFDVTTAWGGVGGCVNGKGGAVGTSYNGTLGNAATDGARAREGEPNIDLRFGDTRFNGDFMICLSCSSEILSPVEWIFSS